MSRVTLVNSSEQIIANLSKSNINIAGKMFLFLNSCPSFHEKLYFKTIYGGQSRIAMLASNIQKKAKDGLESMAIQIFVKISSMLGFKHISYHYEDNKRGYKNVLTKNIVDIKGETI